MAVKLGKEAIEYILKKVLAKKGVQGITTIPGKGNEMLMKQLVDAMTDKMKKLGYDTSKVREKDVQGLLDHAEAIEKQRKTFGMVEVPTERTADVLPFKYKKSFKQEIEEMSKPAPTVGGKTIEEALGGISWADKKKKAKRIKQGLSTKIKLNTLGENKQLAKELVSGKNSEFNTLDKAAKREVLDRLEINIKNTKADFATPVKPKDLASGGSKYIKNLDEAKSMLGRLIQIYL